MNTLMKNGLAVAALAFLCACGSTNYNGVYTGSCTGCTGGSSMTMTLYQQGNNVTGQWVSGSTGGSFSGSANGGSVNSCSFTPAGGSASSQGTLNLSGSTLSGSCGSFTVSLTQSQ